jgi:putative addiction module component (TIGR02574 family)
MTERSMELLEKALALSEEERAELAASLLQSLDQGSDEGAEGAWRKEIDRRLERLNSGEAQTISWDEVQSQMAERLRNGSKKR